MTKEEIIKALRDMAKYPTVTLPRDSEALKAAADLLAQPEQEINKDGSPCPEFWDWLPKAYNFEGNGNFTKYNMEVAFLAGKQASQPEQEPVQWQERRAKRMTDGVVTEWTNWYPCKHRTISEARAEAPDHIPYEWRPLYTKEQL